MRNKKYDIAGRPPLPAHKRRDKRAYVAVSAAELESIDARAEKMGISRHAYLRQIILGQE